MSASYDNSLVEKIKKWGMALGFQQVGVSDINLQQAEQYLNAWLEKDFHGELHYMKKHGLKRSRPALLHEKTKSIISVRMDYLPENHEAMYKNLESPISAYISRYALGRDYHKLMRQRLQKFATKIQSEIGTFGYRAFVDSAPVLEKAIAEKAGLGWIGKHSNLINRKAGSWFFLGEIYTDLDLPADVLVTSHCGSCIACINVCPTQAIVGPYQVDARRCVSYLTIELQGAIPEALRPLMGNRIYGCDDCQLVCPWNRYAHLSKENDFYPRHQLNTLQLLDVFTWTENEFLSKTEGSAIRRLGFTRWMRNIAVALGNSRGGEHVIKGLASRLTIDSDLVREHILWAMKHLSAQSYKVN
jgi:epoxyqueuosine reductase